MLSALTSALPLCVDTLTEGIPYPLLDSSFLLPRPISAPSLSSPSLPQHLRLTVSPPQHSREPVDCFD